MPSLTNSPLGAAHPRVELRPPAVDTLGPIAAELGARAGVVLEPWQRDSLDMLLSTRPDGKWACYEYAELCSRRNGKTAMMLVRALFGFLLLGETPILWTAQEVKTSMRAWRDFRTMLWKLGARVNDNLVDLGEGVQVRINASNGKEGFERVDTGQELKMVARSKDSGRGFDADLVVIDEAYDFTADQQDALAPTQMARPNAQVGYLSSPPLSGTASESLYRLRNRGEAGQGARLGWRDWGRPESLDAVMALSDADRTAFLDDMTIAASANPALGRGRVTLETIRNMRDAMTDRGYAREVLGCWPTQVAGINSGWRVISKDAWQARGHAAERPAAPLVLAVAASWPDAERVSIAVAGAAGAGESAVYVVDHREGTSWAPPRLRELVDRWSPVAVLLDKKSPAGRLISAIEDEGVDLTHPSMDDVATAAGEFYTAVAGDAPPLRHFGQPELDTAVASAGKRPLGSRWTWQLQGATDISPLEAATLAHWGHVAARGHRSAYDEPDAELVIV